MTPTPLTSRAAGWVIFILALGAGFSVASIYYAQPVSYTHLTLPTTPYV